MKVPPRASRQISVQVGIIIVLGVNGADRPRQVSGRDVKTNSAARWIGASLVRMLVSTTVGDKSMFYDWVSIRTLLP